MGKLRPKGLFLGQARRKVLAPCERLRGLPGWLDALARSVPGGSRPHCAVVGSESRSWRRRRRGRHEKRTRGTSRKRRNCRGKPGQTRATEAVELACRSSVFHVAI